MALCMSLNHYHLLKGGSVVRNEQSVSAFVKPADGYINVLHKQRWRALSPLAHSPTALVDFVRCQYTLGDDFRHKSVASRLAVDLWNLTQDHWSVAAFHRGVSFRVTDDERRAHWTNGHIPWIRETATC